MKGWQTAFLLATALVVLAVIVGPYRYQQVALRGQQRLLRTNRITGVSEVLYPESSIGWVPLR